MDTSHPLPEANPAPNLQPVPVAPQPASVPNSPTGSTLVNDIHAALNPTTVHAILPVDSLATLQAAIVQAAQDNRAVSIAGGRHAMGAQQFGTDTLLLDMRPLDRVIAFDSRAGTVEVEAGIQWPALIQCLIDAQQDQPNPDHDHQWGIVQKQTGADRLTIGGAVSANVHGRGLDYAPIVQDVESLQLVDAAGQLHTCSRHENAEMFRLAVGGYGLFGAIYSVKLRLTPRRKIMRQVMITDADQAIATLEQHRAAGCLYGDFQFATDETSRDFLHRGLLATYRPVDDATPLDEAQKELSDTEWMKLTLLGHTDKAQAYALYTGHYLATEGQSYWTDTHQLSPYFDHYHQLVDQVTGAEAPGSEMIAELYVPRPALGAYMAAAAELLRSQQANVIYGTVRLIRRDTETFLAWAKADYACIVINLHVDHTPTGIDQAVTAFRSLIDLAISLGGSFFLTYHKWANRTQIETCYPQFVEFLARKRRYDPAQRFQSDWYRHYARCFEDSGGYGQ